MKARTGQIPKPEPGTKLKPSDFSDVLQTIPGKCVLIGGQAVAWWAIRYGIREGEEGVMSKDIDLWGKHADLVHIADQLKRTPVLPNKYEMTFLVGAMELSAAGRRTTLEILHRVPGLDNASPAAVAVPEDIDKSGSKQILVLSPVSLVVAKLYALQHFAQEERQDLFHLKVSLRTSRCFIADAIQKNTKFALWNCNRLIEVQKRRPNQRLEKQHGIQILSGVPVDQIRAAAQSDVLPLSIRERLQKFLAHQWARVSTAQKSPQAE